MIQPPNLDYDPGPDRASYSRVGPPSETAPGSRPFHIEVADELHPRARGHRRRRSKYLKKH